MEQQTRGRGREEIESQGRGRDKSQRDIGERERYGDRVKDRNTEGRGTSTDPGKARQTWKETHRETDTAIQRDRDGGGERNLQRVK